jgi:hypothetical protein
MRTDLLELSGAILTALANPGLVKRAQREVEQGKFGEPSVAVDETVEVVVDDGSVVTFPVGSGINGSCTCGAAGICRHRIGAVLRYQQAASPAKVEVAAETTKGAHAVAAQEPEESVDPFSYPLPTDAEISAVVPGKTVELAKRSRSRGYLAVVFAMDRSDPEETVPCVVELGTTTVRFLLAADLRYARCDCAKRTACEHVAMASWALHAATSTIDGGPCPAELVVSVGGDSHEELAPDSAGRTGRNAEAEVFRLALLMLDRGVIDVGAGLFLQHSAAIRSVQSGSSVWIKELLGRIPALHAALEHRHAGDIRSELLFTMASLLARQRYRTFVASSGVPAPLPVAAVLGTDERSKSEVAQVRLIGGGAFAAQAPGGGCEVRILLADPASATLLLATKTFRSAEDTELRGPDTAYRALVKGASVIAAATGSLVSNGAVRRPNRSVEFRATGLRQTSGIVGNVSIDRFREGGLVSSPGEILRSAAQRAPRVLRPLVLTEDFVALSIDSVHAAAFDPADQCVRVYAESAGEAVLLESTYTDAMPGGPATLAGFVSEMLGSTSTTGNSFVVGRARITNNGVVVMPTLLGSTTLVAPALTQPDAKQLDALADLPLADHGVPQPVTVLVNTVLGLTADLLVDGTRDPTRWIRRAESTVTDLANGGLSAMASVVQHLIEVVGERGQRGGKSSSDTDQALVNAWADAAFMALTAADQRL